MEIGIAEHAHQFAVMGQVDARLGHEFEGIAMPGLPVDESGQELFHRDDVADEIVVHDENRAAPAGVVQAAQLPQHLVGGFDPGAAAVEDHDVAELAIERAAARVLHGHGDVVPEVDQIPLRDGRARDVRPLGGGIQGFGRSLAQILQKGRQGDFGFVENEMVHAGKPLGLGGKRRAAGHDAFAHAPGPGDDVPGSGLLHEHGADQDHVRPGQVLVAKGGDVDVDKPFFPLRREHGGDGQQAERRKGRFAGEKGENMFEAPEGVGIDRINEKGLHNDNPSVLFGVASGAGHFSQYSSEKSKTRAFSTVLPRICSQ